MAGAVLVGYLGSQMLMQFAVDEAFVAASHRTSSTLRPSPPFSPFISGATAAVPTEDLEENNTVMFGASSSLLTLGLVAGAASALRRAKARTSNAVILRRGTEIFLFAWLGLQTMLLFVRVSQFAESGGLDEWLSDTKEKLSDSQTKSPATSSEPSVPWAPDGRAELSRFPSTMHGRIRKMTEAYAMSQGIKEITPAVISAAEEAEAVSA